MEDKMDLILSKLNQMEKTLTQIKSSLDSHRHEHTAQNHPAIAGQLQGGDAGMGGGGMFPGGIQPGAPGFMNQGGGGGGLSGPPGM
tara:strand:+ start:2199 stop:2456 length:258 start_codon:yes stop_codon:yes gene_type:complete